MTVLERKKFEQRKIKLSRAIMNDMNEERVSQIERLYDDHPLLYSAEELNDSLCQIEQELANGNMKEYTSEQMRKYAV